MAEVVVSLIAERSPPLREWLTKLLQTYGPEGALAVLLDKARRDPELLKVLASVAVVRSNPQRDLVADFEEEWDGVEPAEGLEHLVVRDRLVPVEDRPVGEEKRRGGAAERRR